MGMDQIELRGRPAPWDCAKDCWLGQQALDLAARAQENTYIGCDPYGYGAASDTLWLAQVSRDAEQVRTCHGSQAVVTETGKGKVVRVVDQVWCPAVKGAIVSATGLPGWNTIANERVE